MHVLARFQLRYLKQDDMCVEDFITKAKGGGGKVQLDLADS